MTVRELRKKAKRLGLKGYSSLNKSQLIEYISTGNKPSKNRQKRLIRENKQLASSINKILTGDCLGIMPKFPDKVFDCCIADPPFNMSKKKGLDWAFSSHVTMQEQWDIFTKDEYFKFTLDWINEVKRIVKKNGNIFVFGSFHSIFTIGFILQNILNLRIITQIVWYKPNAQPNITCRMFTESTEFIIWAVNSPNKR